MNKHAVLIHGVRLIVAATLTAAMAVGPAAIASPDDGKCVANGRSTATCCPLGASKGTTVADQSNGLCGAAAVVHTQPARQGGSPPVISLPGMPNPSLGGLSGAVGGVASSVGGAVGGMTGGAPGG